MAFVTVVMVGFDQLLFLSRWDEDCEDHEDFEDYRTADDSDDDRRMRRRRHALEYVLRRCSLSNGRTVRSW